MIIVETIADVRTACDRARALGRTVGLVPTMGYFHDGHRSLMRVARARDDLVIVSLFVNPTQFAPSEDLSAYPRDLAGDAAAAAAEGVDLLFAPSAAEIYPTGTPFRTVVHVDELGDHLCGASRPGHFDGVTTVVAKLFSIVGPCRAYFGKKDAQQLAVVRRMASDLDLPVEVVSCPLVREPDGLAMSSRNVYLDDDERRAATVLWRALHEAAEAVGTGVRDATALRRALVARIESEPLASLDYAEVVDGATLEPVTWIEGQALVAVAARVGRARLIDNITIVAGRDSAAVDEGVFASSTPPVRS